MEWLLGISVVFNILLLMVIVYFIWVVGELKGFGDMCHKQWEEWETRYYKIQYKLIEEHNLFIHIDGLKSEMKIETKND